MVARRKLGKKIYFDLKPINYNYSVSRVCVKFAGNVALSSVKLFIFMVNICIKKRLKFFFLSVSILSFKIFFFLDIRKVIKQ
jgi:hypothetical protein